MGVMKARKGTRSLYLSNSPPFALFAGVTVLLSLTVFSIMVTEMLPKVSDAVPVLG